MKPETDTEILECPFCQGTKKIRWNNQDYPCRICDGTGHIELKAPHEAILVTN